VSGGVSILSGGSASAASLAAHGQAPVSALVAHIIDADRRKAALKTKKLAKRAKKGGAAATGTGGAVAAVGGAAVKAKKPKKERKRDRAAKPGKPGDDAAAAGKGAPADKKKTLATGDHSLAHGKPSGKEALKRKAGPAGGGDGKKKSENPDKTYKDKSASAAKKVVIKPLNASASAFVSSAKPPAPTAGAGDTPRRILSNNGPKG
jgi:hypothetical protein